MGARGFCNVKQNESDIRPSHAKVHHLQHQAFVFKKNHNPSVHPLAIVHLKQSSDHYAVAIHHKCSTN